MCALFLRFDQLKATDIVCHLCHARHNREIHPGLRDSGDHALTEEEEFVDGWLDVAQDGEVPPRYEIKYHSSKGNSSLKYHVARYHAREEKLLTSHLDVAPKQISAQKRPPTPGEQISKAFKSTKTVSKSSKQGSRFIQMLSLMIVFCNQAISIVENPMFRAFCWFLDPSVPFPSRRDMTSNYLPAIMKDVECLMQAAFQGLSGSTSTCSLEVTSYVPALKPTSPVDMQVSVLTRI